MPVFDEDKNQQVSAAAITDLTAASGTASNTIADVTDTHDQTILNNNFKSLAAKINAIEAALRDAAVIALD